MAVADPVAKIAAERQALLDRKLLFGPSWNSPQTQKLFNDWVGWQMKRLGMDPANSVLTRNGLETELQNHFNGLIGSIGE